jgi:hypothetical protein
MAVSGTINVNLSALDTYTTDGVDSEKKVVLSSSDNLSSAVVAVASGTCGTTAVNVDFSEFRGADGELVLWDSYLSSTRIAFAASPSAQLDWDDVTNLRLTSRNNAVAITSLPLGTLPLSPGAMQVKTITPFGIPPPPPVTASYTVVMLREA